MTTALSAHAAIRAQQRGVPLGLIDTIVEHHDIDWSVGDDCRVLRLSAAATASAEVRRLAGQHVDRLCRLAVVWSDRKGQVVTVLRPGKRASGRRYRRVA